MRKLERWYSSLPWRWRIGIVVGSVVVIIVAIAVGSAGGDGEGGDEEVTALETPTEEATPAGEATTVTPTQEAVTETIATQEPPDAKPDWIPGLTSGDITGNLEDRGFDCEGPELGQTLALWDCLLTAPDGSLEYRVSFMGETPTRIRSVSATLLDYRATPNDEAATDFLGFIATLPYDGSEPDRARQWVEDDIASGGEMVIGGARFILFGPPRARSLDIVAVGAQ